MYIDKNTYIIILINTNLYTSKLMCKLRIQGSSLILKTSFAGKPHSQRSSFCFVPCFWFDCVNSTHGVL